MQWLILCQLIYATVPRYLAKHSLDIFEWVFLDEICISISGLWVKQIALNNVGEPHLIGWKHK